MYCNIWINIENLKATKVSYIKKKTLSLSIVYSNFSHEYEKIFKEEESMEILKIIGLIDNIETYLRIYNHAWRKYKSKIQNKKVDEIRNYLIEEINQNILMSKKHKKSCEVLNYIHHLLIVVSTITGCISISAFASSVRIPIGITSSATGLKICVRTAGIKRYKSIIKKRKKHMIK